MKEVQKYYEMHEEKEEVEMTPVSQQGQPVKIESESETSPYRSYKDRWGSMG